MDSFVLLCCSVLVTEFNDCQDLRNNAKRDQVLGQKDVLIHPEGCICMSKWLMRADSPVLKKVSSDLVHCRLTRKGTFSV